MVLSKILRGVGMGSDRHHEKGNSSLFRQLFSYITFDTTPAER